MYIWKTTKLSTEIKENTLTEKDWKQYFLAGTILITVSMYLLQIESRTIMESLIVEAVLMVAIAITGINIAFKTNQKNNGTNFVARMTALTFPISIKLIALSVLFGVALGVAEEVAGLTPESIEWATVVFGVLIQILFFWRINVHLKYINT